MHSSFANIFANILNCTLVVAVVVVVVVAAAVVNPVVEEGGRGRVKR